jgi:UDPglucose 6-dehydrogenase
MDAVKAKLGDKVRYAETPLAACQGADALLIATEWAQYRAADLEAVAKALKARRIFDGRNLFRPEAMAAAGWTYLSLGRQAVGKA